MTEHDALLHAICHHPDDDTPRLIFADYLDENGEPDRAAFIRAQVEAARLPDWEPFPVYCRHRKPEWSHGKPWANTLPALDGWNVEWVSERPAFERGLGSRVRLRSLIAWEQIAEPLLNRVPLRDFWLRAPATLDDWRRFAAAAWVAQIRHVHLESSPTEPLRGLCESPHATGITDLHLNRADSPGIPFIVTDLLASPLGHSLRGLHFRMGYEALDDLIEALAPGEWSAFERISMRYMGLTPELVQRWSENGGLRNLTGLDLRGNRALGGDGLRAFARGLEGTSLCQLLMADVALTAEGIESLGGWTSLSSLRHLDLSENPLRPRDTRVFSAIAPLSGLRALNLSKCRIGDKGVRHLTRAKFWPNLVELDLRENPITVQSVKHLLLAEVPRDLTALLLDGTELGVDSRTALRQKFGEAVLFHG